MSIDSPTGILDIRNATLKVSKLEVTNATGFDTALNNIARNTILLVDSTEQTASNSWALKLPNAWVGEFEGYWASGASGDIDFNFYNNTTSGTNGYTLSMDDTTIVVKYDGVTKQTTTISSTLKTDAYRKVSILFERDTISVSIDGVRELYFKDDTLRSRVYDDTAGGYITVGGLDATNRKFKNLKVVNEKWISDGTSNIAYVGSGEVTVGPSLNLKQVSNTASIKYNSNVVTEFVRSKKLIKYPRVTLTADSSGGYVVSGSSVRNSSYPFHNAFDETNDVSVWQAQINTFTNGVANTGTFEGITCQYISIDLGRAILLQYVVLYSRTSTNTYAPVKGKIYGSNDETNYTLVATYDNLSMGANENVRIFATTNQYFRYFTFTVEEALDSGADDTTVIRALEYYGIPEYDPEAHGTDVIMRSVPNVPNTDWLEVYWDAGNTSSYSGSGTTVTDLSGNGVTGTINGTNGFDSTYNAWEFDGTGDYISSTHPLGTGAPAHSISFWFKNTEANPYYRYIAALGGAGYGNQSSFRLTGTRLEYGKRDYTINAPNAVPNNAWVHAVSTFTGGTFSEDNIFLYVNGVNAEELPGYFKSEMENQTGTTLNIVDDELYLGSATNSTGGFQGYIANYRLFNRALSADEVWQLYAYQKEYFDVSPDVVTFKGGRLGIGTSEPGAVLDVRGSARFANLHVNGSINHGNYNYISGGSAGGYKDIGNDTILLWGYATVYVTTAKQYNWTWYFPNSLTLTETYCATAEISDPVYGYSSPGPFTLLGLTGFATNRVSGHLKSQDIVDTTLTIWIMAIGKKT